MPDSENDSNLSYIYKPESGDGNMQTDGIHWTLETMLNPDISQKVLNFCAKILVLLQQEILQINSPTWVLSIYSLKTAKEVDKMCLELIYCYKKYNMSLAKLYSNSHGCK